MRRMLIPLLIVLALVYAGICAWLFLHQRSLQYFPQPRRGGGAYVVEAFRSGDALLQLTVRPHAGPGAVLYFGGNGEDVSGSIATIAAAFPEREIVMLHYRGYGGSTGQATEEAITADAAALFDKVHAAHPDVIVIGRSLGGGVAMRLASTRPVSRVVLVTPYDSLLEIAQRQFPWLPVRWLLVDKYESWRYVPQVKAPVLILAAENDEVIPAASTERLRNRFPTPQMVYIVVPGASHNTIGDSPVYARTLTVFDEASMATMLAEKR